MTNYFIRNRIAFLAVFFLSVACTSSQNIFPGVVTSLSESAAVLPNPISVVADPNRSQIIVANSNVDIFFDQGSLAVLSVDATDVNSPILTATSVTPAPNFAGQIHFDSTNSAIYVPFRETSATDQSLDQILRYDVTAGTVSLNTSARIAANPFGVTGNESRIYAVSDDVLSVFDTSLGSIDAFNLKAPKEAGLTDVDSKNVEYVAINSTASLAVVSNANGKMFIVDLTTGVVAFAVSGPDLTRNLLIDADNLLYAIDPASATLWVFDLDFLAAAGASPNEVDDSTFLIATVPVGANPNGMALDAAAKRLYVGNSAENSISVIDTLTFQEIARISVDAKDLTNYNRGADFPFALSLGTFNGTTFLFVAGYEANSVAVINTNTLKVVEVYPNNNL